MKDISLNKMHLKVAFEQFASNPGTLPKLKWWLTRAHSAERWFQFEYAFQLDECLAPSHRVICERKYVDIVVVPNTPSDKMLCELEPTAKLELKVNGNWYVIGKTYPDIKADMAKATDKHKDTQSAMLAMWIAARPKDCKMLYKWIADQIDDGTGRERMDDIEREMEKECGPGIQLLSKHSFSDDDDFDTLELRLYCYANQPLAEQAL